MNLTPCLTEEVAAAMEATVARVYEEGFRHTALRHGPAEIRIRGFGMFNFKTRRFGTMRVKIRR
jgi:hypothetical protein